MSKYSLKIAYSYLGSTALDFLSSLKNRRGFEETNPYARHMDGTFWPRHALIDFGVVTAEYCVLSWLFWVAASELDPKYRRLAASLPWLYVAGGHILGAFGNLLNLWPGLYVETAGEMFKRLIGQ